MVALSQANSITISIFYFVSTVLTWPSIWKFLHMTCNLCPSCLTLSTPFSSSVEWETEFYGTERLTKTKNYTSHKYPNWSKILCRQNWSFWQKQFSLLLLFLVCVFWQSKILKLLWNFRNNPLTTLTGVCHRLQFLFCCNFAILSTASGETYVV